MANEQNLTPFSSTYQPAPEKKRVPKYKTRLKKFIIDNIDIVNEQMKKGNHKFWEIAFERGYGKEKENIDHLIKVDKTILEIIAEQLTKKNEVQKTD